MKYSIISAALLASIAYATPIYNSAVTTLPANATILAGNPRASPNPVPEPGFVKSLLVADSSIDKFTQLKAQINAQKASIKFDFNPAANPATIPGAGGAVYLANRVSYPAVTNLGIAGAALFFAPCGLNTPHIHPRGSEFFTVATNSTLVAGFVLENGFVNEQNTTLTQYQGMVFPMGSIHWQQNTECTPAVGIAAFNGEDPGTSSMAQNFLVNTNSGVVRAAIGYPDHITSDNYNQFKSMIPKPMAANVEECYKRCGFTS